MSLIDVRTTTAATATAMYQARSWRNSTASPRGRGALAELRRLLGVLRAEVAERAASPASPTCTEPVRGAERSGAQITLTWHVERTTIVGDLASLAAYRIVQEAVGNALRHASGAAIAVRVSDATTRSSWPVTNDGSRDPRSRANPATASWACAEGPAGVGHARRTPTTQGWQPASTLPLRATEGEDRASASAS